jgi:hypothetical protein
LTELKKLWEIPVSNFAEQCRKSAEALFACFEALRQHKEAALYQLSMMCPEDFDVLIKRNFSGVCDWQAFEKNLSMLCNLDDHAIQGDVDIGLLGLLYCDINAGPANLAEVIKARASLPPTYFAQYDNAAMELSWTFGQHDIVRADCALDLSLYSYGQIVPAKKGILHQRNIYSAERGQALLSTQWNVMELLAQTAFDLAALPVKLGPPRVLQLKHELPGSAYVSLWSIARILSVLLKVSSHNEASIQETIKFFENDKSVLEHTQARKTSIEQLHGTSAQLLENVVHTELYCKVEHLVEMMLLQQEVEKLHALLVDSRELSDIACTNALLDASEGLEESCSNIIRLHIQCILESCPCERHGLPYDKMLDEAAEGQLSGAEWLVVQAKIQIFFWLLQGRLAVCPVRVIMRMLQRACLEACHEDVVTSQAFQKSICLILLAAEILECLDVLEVTDVLISFIRPDQCSQVRQFTAKFPQLEQGPGRAEQTKIWAQAVGQNCGQDVLLGITLIRNWFARIADEWHRVRVSESAGEHLLRIFEAVLGNTAGPYIASSEGIAPVINQKSVSLRPKTDRRAAKLKGRDRTVPQKSSPSAIGLRPSRTIGSLVQPSTVKKPFQSRSGPAQKEGDNDVGDNVSSGGDTVVLGRSLQEYNGTPEQGQRHKQDSTWSARSLKHKTRGELCANNTAEQCTSELMREVGQKLAFAKEKLYDRIRMIFPKQDDGFTTRWLSFDEYEELMTSAPLSFSKGHHRDDKFVLSRPAQDGY